MTLQTHVFLSEFATAIAISGYHNEAESYCDASLTTLKTMLAEEQPLLAYARIHCADVAIGHSDYAAAENLLSGAVPVVTDTLGEANGRWRCQRLRGLRACAAG